MDDAEALFGASRGARDVIQVVIDTTWGLASLPMVICYTQAAVARGNRPHTGRPVWETLLLREYGCLETIASVDSILELAQLRSINP